jgi:hypothetical protein
LPDKAFWSTISSMEGRIKYPLRIAVLVLYCVYAMSPIYLSALVGKNDWTAECGDPDKNITIGIVWVNVLLSKIVGADHSGKSAPTEVRTGGHEREFILIKKKRAVVRETFRVRPLLIKQAAASIGERATAEPSVTLEIPRRPNLRFEDLYIFSHVGLSPPLVSA